MRKRLIEYHSSPIQQKESWTCGEHATAFAIEAKAKMRDIPYKLDIQRLIDIWKTKRDDGMGFLLPLKKSLNVFEGENLGSNITITNIQNDYSISFETICMIVDNMATPILAISFPSRRQEDGVTVYSSKKVGASYKNHIVAVVDYTGDYLILRDSNGGKYNRIYKQDISIVKSIAIFNIAQYVPKFIYPIKEVFVTQGFGVNKGYYSQFGGEWTNGHMGVDFRTKTDKNPNGIGTEIIASHKGIVKTGFTSLYGNYIELEDIDSDTITRYCHLSKFNCSDGDIAKQGQVIGFSGNTGNSTAPHLHFELIKEGKRVNPVPFLG